MATKYEIQRAAYRVTDGDYAYDGFTSDQWYEMGKSGIASALDELNRKGRKPSKRKPKKSASNPRGQLLFSTRAAAVKYAREHGAKKFSVRKLKRGRA